MIFLQEKSRKGMRGLRYYIADLHFFHGALNDRMDRRGFADTEAMNAYMLERWNGKVRKNDEVIILGEAGGDWCVSEAAERQAVSHPEQPRPVSDG